MKKLFIFIFATLTITSLVFAGETRYNFESLTDSSQISKGVQIQIDENRVMTLSNLFVVPEKVNPNNERWAADTVKLYSGILEISTKNALAVNAEVVNGKISEQLHDLGTALGGPVVEHFWAKGNSGDKVDYPLLLGANNPWVCYQANEDGSVNQEKLFIGMVFYPKTNDFPGGVVLPLKLVLEIKGIGDNGTYFPQHLQPELNLSSSQMEKAINAMGLPKVAKN